MKIKTLLILFLVLSNIAFSQRQPIYFEYDWSETPAIHVIAENAQSYPAVFVLHNRISELKVVKKIPRTFYTEHKIIHVNSNAGIEKYNKVYIPISNDRKIVALKVRAISPEGKITNLRQENLKELSNVEGYGSFKIFAIEGLIVGGELEYLYTTEANPQVSGRELFQKDIPILEASFKLIFPKSYPFTAKSYNGLPKPSLEPLDKKRKIITMVSKNIVALEEEPEEEPDDAYNANLLRVDYKLLSAPGFKDFMTWENISKRILENAYSNRANFRINKMLKPIVSETMSMQQKIQAVEQYIKTNFTIKEGRNDAYENLPDILDNRVANEKGMVKLYLSCWQTIGVYSQLVFAPNRFRNTLDPNFSSSLDFDEILFYFPSMQQYLAPGISYMRLGPAPENVAGGNGLFISYAFTPGIDYKSFAINTISPLDFEHNKLGVKAVVSFKEDLSLPEISQENSWQGYRAAQYRGAYYFQSPEDKEEFIAQNTLSAVQNVSVISREIIGEDLNLSFDTDKYFTVNTKYTSPSLVEKAGDDYLFFVGKIIGKQSELYGEKQRQSDIVSSSISNYTHEIVFDIPAGYDCTGLTDFRITNEVRNGDDVLMKFSSDYTQEDRKITIRVNEFYKVLSLPKQKYEDFRKVVNSAADFSKLVLVLHPVSSLQSAIGVEQ
jgi:hypothetical protein